MIKSITSVNVAGRRVIVRVGFDVPLVLNIHTENLEVIDDARIKDTLDTIKYLIDNRAKIILISHLGRPKGWEDKKSLWPVALKLSELLNIKAVKVSNRLPDYKVPHLNFLETDITKKDYSDFSNQINPGDVLFLENLRFYEGEETNDEGFIKTLAKFGDIYVNEAFSVCHRKESSIYGLPLELPSYAGISLQKEIASLKKIVKNPKQPLVLIMGGAKIEDKIETINFLGKSAAYFLFGGGLANTFLKAKGYEIGKSICGDINIAKELLRNFKEKIILPVDLVVAQSLEAKPRLAKPDKILSNESIYDIGPETIRKYAEYVKTAKTLVWNGPFGIIEEPRYAFGSKSIAHVFAAQSKGRAFGLAGGGETIEVIDMAKVGQFIDHISMGGGAMLEFLAGKKLPGIKALER